MKFDSVTERLVSMFILGVISEELCLKILDSLIAIHVAEVALKK